jgi:hypothetical protein
MDGLVFLVVIVVFSLLEGVLRKKKAAQQARLSGQAPDDGQYGPTQDGQLEDGRYGLVQEQFEATYDGEPSYDDDPPAYDEAHGILEYSNQYTEAPPSKPAPSETLIPKDVWEELAALVSGAQPQASDLERPAPPAPRAETTAVARTETTAVTQRATRGLTTRPEHIVHDAHAAYGTDPSQRAPSEQDGLDPLAEHLGADARAVHQLFASRDSHALQQAIILQEVLGLPAAFRGDPYDP